MPLRLCSIPRAIAVRAVIILSLAAATGAGAMARGGAGLQPQAPAAGVNIAAHVSSRR